MGRYSNIDGCGKFIKWSLAIFNFIIFLGGVSVLGVGIWTVIDKSYLETLLRNDLYMAVAYILIAVGIFTLFLSIFGYIGALKEIKWVLLTYFVVILLTFSILVIGGVLCYVFRGQIRDNLRPEMLHTIEMYDPSKPNDPITKAWDYVQTKLMCCGIRRMGSSNSAWMAWKKNFKINSGIANAKVPTSCCMFNADGKRLDCTSEDFAKESMLFKDDCFDLALAFVVEHAHVLGGVSIGIASTMVFGMVFSIALFNLIE